MHRGHKIRETELSISEKSSEITKSFIKTRICVHKNIDIAPRNQLMKINFGERTFVLSSLKAFSWRSVIHMN